MRWGPALRSLAALCIGASAAAESFDLPDIPLALRPLLEARLANAAAIVTSLPAHPMGPAFLDGFVAFLVDGMAREKIDSQTALRLICANFGDKSIGIFAVDRYADRHGVEDGFLGWLVEAQGSLRASCRAQDWLVRAGRAPNAPPSGRGAVFARLRAAAALPSSMAGAIGSLRAWAEAADLAQAQSAGLQARYFLEAPPLTPINSVLEFNPVPPALLIALAAALDDPAGVAWLTVLEHPVAEPPLPPESLAPSAIAAGYVARLVGQAEVAGTAGAGFDAIVGALPPDVQAYLALPVAQQLIKDLNLDDAETRLENAARLDTRGAWSAPITVLRMQCRAGIAP